MILDGKVAIITGGGSGVGAAIARAFAREGAQVVIGGRREAQLRAAAAAIAAPRPLRWAALDVSDRAQVRAVVEGVAQDFGGVDILVNNAGVNIRNRRVEVLAPEDWDALMEINATGAFNMIHAVLPLMRARREGLIISISSTSGLRPSSLGGAAYSAAKSALAALTRVVGQEEAANGIRTSVISPGEIDTPLLAQRPTPVTDEHRARMLQPEDVAAAALFVAGLPPRAHVPELVIMPTAQAFV
ncbi:MAG TPA: SDR family NAD(P)-dependent oxidoreductase [Roseiflexaceae bacterium]|nr:SDR family NAD(P)-dependent oxidoreductase [Roseiflexaceae bacterium]